MPKNGQQNSLKLKKQMRYLFLLLMLGITSSLLAQDSTNVYKKRVLDVVEVDFLSSFYMQDGENAAVTGGIGTESLQDVTGGIVIAIPLGANGVLSIDGGVSAYTSASSSNVNPFDGDQPADAFVASSGESKSDVWNSGSISYSHSSKDRNEVWSLNAAIASEYDYQSYGVGGSFSKLFNQKNTEVSIKANAFFDSWKFYYPREFRKKFKLSSYDITGNPNYTNRFNELSGQQRNSYNVGLGFSQILSRNIQASLAADFVLQQGLLSTPFQRVYFGDVEDTFAENFHLADDIEQLPNTRFKTAIGGRLHIYLNEFLSIRSFYRYYTDDWGIQSNTASIEIPIKLFLGRITLYPSYRFYNQSAANYFKPYNEHLSSDTYYTSDYDLSAYQANQFGFGISYTDVLSQHSIWRIGFKSVDLKFYRYDRNSTLYYNMATIGVKFVIE